MARKLLGGAVSVIRHIAWYVNHQLGGEAREREDPEERADH
jgi:hypothetical protein